MRRSNSGIMARLVRLGAVAALVGALAGCGGGDGGEPGAVATGEPISFEQLALAADTSARATSGRFAFSFQMSFPGADEPLAFAGEGAFDAASERAAFTMDLSSFGMLLGGLFAGLGGVDAPDLDDPDAWRIEAVQEGSNVYVRFPALDEQLPAGKSWVRSDDGGRSGVQGLDLSQLQQVAGSDPRTMLDFLRALSGGIEAVGVEELRGVETTHYRATIDPRSYEQLVPAEEREQLRSLADQMLAQSGLGTIPVDVWVDERGLVRRLTMAIAATQPGTTDSVEASLTFELYDYGEKVEIELPPASQVVDASALGR